MATKTQSGKVNTSLFMSKSGVAPLKYLLLLRLKMMEAVIGAHLSHKSRELYT